MERVESHIRELVGPLDPVRDEPAALPPPSPVTASAVRCGRPLVGRWSIAAAAAIVVATAMMAWSSVGPNTPRGIAATPAPLVLIAPTEPTPGAQVLADLARKAAASGVPARTGPTEYIEMRNWYLNSQISEGATVSVIQPEIRKTWRSPDDSGRIEVNLGDPEFRSDADREAWAGGATSVDSEEWKAGGRSFSFGRERPPTEAPALAQRLYRENPPDSIGAIKTFVAATDLLRERVLLPQERAAMLDMVAGLPGLTYQGQTHDRVGRSALAFSMDSAYGGLPARYTLLIDPESGMILGNEQMLTSSSGALNVAIPAVLKYETYVQAKFV